MQHRCPSCGGANVRRSTVRGPERVFTRSPYRCRDCKHKFWVTSRKVYRLAAWMAGVAPVIAVLAWTLLARPQPIAVGQARVRFEELLKRAEAKDRDAEYDVSGRYALGDGVTRNTEEARKWLERAAEHGSVVAEYDLGMAFYEGTGGLQDYERGISLIRKAAEGGHARAQSSLGMMYRSGTGLKVDQVRAYMWLNLAVAGGEKSAAAMRDAAAEAFGAYPVVFQVQPMKSGVRIFDVTASEAVLIRHSNSGSSFTVSMEGLRKDEEGARRRMLGLGAALTMRAVDLARQRLMDAGDPLANFEFQQKDLGPYIGTVTIESAQKYAREQEAVPAS